MRWPAGATLIFAPEVVAWHPTRDRAKPFFRAQWIYSRGYAASESRRDELPLASGYVLGSRWSSPCGLGKAGEDRYGPDRKWLGENGVSPSRAETLKALPIMYLVVPYLRGVAQVRGWLDGRRLRTVRR